MPARDCILVTGGAGFVGSHFAVAAHAAGSRVVVLDDLSGGSRPTLPAGIELVVGDIGDRAIVQRIIRDHGVTAVAHFAGLIQVGESVREPAKYFERNVVRSLALLEAIRGHVDTFLFSSTAAIYGMPIATPIPESAARAPINPYGSTKLAIELALEAWGGAYGLRWGALRYFNAAGAQPDGSLRENHDPETHLIPLVIDAALGRRPALTIFGTDYGTPDGTCVRDYIHVVDLAAAHLAALDTIDRQGPIGAINLGTARGYSVREVVDTAARVLGREVPHAIGARRPGDPDVLVASTDRAADVLGWRAARSDLATIIDDAVRSRR